MNHGFKLHPDGTLEITMPKGKKVSRVLVCEAGTQNGTLMYPDCDDCIKHGGEWECDHVNCHKGKDVPDIFDKDSLIDVLEKCGILWSDKLEKVITVKALALFYGEKYETLQKKMERFAIDLFEDIREINKNDELFDRLKRNGIISNKAPKITVVSPSGVAKIAYFSEGVKQYEVRHALNEIDHRLHKELSVKYSDIYFSKIYQKEMSYLVNNIFRFHKVENEKYVEGYRIDFLIDNHIAIECDESVHDYYNKEHEESRKKLMETKGYTFYRYDVRKGNMLSFIGNLIDKEWIRPNVGDMISRQAAIDATYAETVSTNPEHFKSSKKFIGYMDDIDISDFGRWQWANGFNTALVAIKIKFEKLPSAEPQRKNGKWIDKSGDIEGAWNYCSVCGEQAIDLYDFCPNCGADMRGEKDG